MPCRTRSKIHMLQQHNVTNSGSLLTFVYLFTDTKCQLLHIKRSIHLNIQIGCVDTDRWPKRCPNTLVVFKSRNVYMFSWMDGSPFCNCHLPRSIVVDTFPTYKVISVADGTEPSRGLCWGIAGLTERFAPHAAKITGSRLDLRVLIKDWFGVNCKCSSCTTVHQSPVFGSGQLQDIDFRMFGDPTPGQTLHCTKIHRS